MLTCVNTMQMNAAGTDELLRQQGLISQLRRTVFLSVICSVIFRRNSDWVPSRPEETATQKRERMILNRRAEPLADSEPGNN